MQDTMWNSDAPTELQCFLSHRRLRSCSSLLFDACEMARPFSPTRRHFSAIVWLVRSSMTHCHWFVRSCYPELSESAAESCEQFNTCSHEAAILLARCQGLRSLMLRVQIRKLISRRSLPMNYPTVSLPSVSPIYMTYLRYIASYQ